MVAYLVFEKAAWKAVQRVYAKVGKMAVEMVVTMAR